MATLLEIAGVLILGPLCIAALSWILDGAPFAHLQIFLEDWRSGKVGIHQCPNRATKALYGDSLSEYCDACFWRLYEPREYHTDHDFSYIRKWFKPRCAAGRTFDYREFLQRPRVNSFEVEGLMALEIRKDVEKKGSLLMRAVDRYLQESESPLFIERGIFRDSTYVLRLSGFGKKRGVSFSQESVDDSVDGKSRDEALLLLDQVVKRQMTKAT